MNPIIARDKGKLQHLDKGRNDRPDDKGNKGNVEKDCEDLVDGKEMREISLCGNRGTVDISITKPARPGLI